MAEITAYSLAWRRHRRAAVLHRIERLRRLAWTLDALGRVPGTRLRFGLNSLIGLAPVAGDAVMAMISLYIVAEAVRLGLPRRKIVRMLANVGIEAAAGSVPILGDIFDTFWKANLRNVAIIDAHLAPVQRGGRDPGEPRRR
jgi:hypothetical protein